MQTSDKSDAHELHIPLDSSLLDDPMHVVDKGKPATYKDSLLKDIVLSAMSDTEFFDDDDIDILDGDVVRVNIDLDKPLVSKLVLNGRIRMVEYESIPLICFHCGKYGHLQEACPSLYGNEEHDFPAPQTSVTETKK
ncbi:hypothetical protein V6N12_045198 [Hibiscus sabdariffa]|uniref:CCHC-type domain-containing protein n=1 Tax=Hibiscus sabdariffa TaxID=183260 RepID=A0ABR2G249_9ROSI